MPTCDMDGFFAYDVWLPEWCLPTCIIPAQLYDVCLLVDVLQPVWCLPPCAMSCYFAYDAWLPVLCLPTCIISAQLFDVCLLVCCMSNCMMSVYLYYFCLLYCVCSTVYCLPGSLKSGTPLWKKMLLSVDYKTRCFCFPFHGNNH